VTEIVFTLGVGFDIFPFEVGAAASRGLLASSRYRESIENVPAAFFAHCLNEIHGVELVNAIEAQMCSKVWRSLY